MSGVRRKTKYRKGVEEEVFNSLPEPSGEEVVVRVVAPRGGNLVEVESSDGTKSLCRLPNRFRKVVWVKRGTLLIVDTCREVYSTAAGEEGKVTYIVNHVIFTDDQVKNLRQIGALPSEFDSKPIDDLSSNMDELLSLGNRNRRPQQSTIESDSDSDDSEDSNKEDEKQEEIDDPEEDGKDGSDSNEDEESDEEDEE